MSEETPGLVPDEGAQPAIDLRRSFVSGIAWSGAAKAAAQLFTWMSTFVVARLLTPGDYGIVQMAAVYLSFVALFNEFGIGAAVVTLRELRDEQIAHLNSFAVLLGIGSVIVTAAIARPLGGFFDEPRLPLLLVVMGIGFVFTAARTVPQALLQRDLRFKMLGGIEAGQAVLAAAVTVALAWVGAGYWALVVGTLAGFVAWSLMTLLARRHRFAWPKLAPVRYAMQFSGEIFVANLAWFFYSSTHFLIVGKLVGASALGAYSFAWGLACMPVDKITAMLTGVMPAFFSALKDDRPQLRSYFLTITEGLAFVTFPMTLGIALVADEFIPIVLGDAWLGAIRPLQILAAYAAFQAIASSVPQVLRVVGETRYFMYGNMVIAVGLQLAFAVGIQYGVTGICVAWVVAYPVLTLPLYHRAFRALAMGPGPYLRALWPALSGCVVMAASVLALRHAWPQAEPSPFSLALHVTTGALAYAGATLALHRNRLLELRALAVELRARSATE